VKMKPGDLIRRLLPKKKTDKDAFVHVPAENCYPEIEPFKPVTREDFERVRQQVMQEGYGSFRGVQQQPMTNRYYEQLRFMREEMEERERLAQEHAKRILMIKQDNALDLIKRHCLACQGYISNSLLPPRIELTRRNAEGTAPETARIAITCPVCGYVMMFDVELSESEMLLPVPKEPGY